MGDSDSGEGRHLPIVRWQNQVVHNLASIRATNRDGGRRGTVPVMTRGRDSITRLLVTTTAVALILLTIVGCGDEGAGLDETTQPPFTPQAAATTPVSPAALALSDMARAGQDLFNANCSVCHGANASGTDQGPTLIDRIYHPGHHSDFSFRNAVSKGVRQHHWSFGAMPPVATVSADDVEKITCYVRELQRANGIFEGDAFATVC